MAKKVLLKPRFRGRSLHSLYDEAIENPPPGFTLEYEKDDEKDLGIYSLDSKSVNPIIKELSYHLKPFPYLIAQKMQKNNFSGYDLVYASQHFLFDSRVPWVTDLEYANALVAYGNISVVKNIVRNALESKKCKFILPWSEWSKETLLNSIDCNNLKDKIKVIRYTVKPKQISKRPHETVNFLYVGSSNLMNWRNIMFKSLKETIIAFDSISKKYDNIHLTVRSYLPPKLKELASRNTKITIIDSILSKEKLYQLYLDSDVFVLPSHETLGISLLDAMSFELAPIAINIYDIPEAITHMKSGLLVEGHKDMRYYTKTRIPYDYSWRFASGMAKYSDYLVKELQLYFKLLIEDSSLRKKLAVEARKTIEVGQFSMENRNTHLSSVFESSTK